MIIDLILYKLYFNLFFNIIIMEKKFVRFEGIGNEDLPTRPQT